MGNDALFVNKIAAAILSAGLLAMLTGFASYMLYSPKQLDKPAYIIAADEPTRSGELALLFSSSADLAPAAADAPVESSSQSSAAAQ